ncbi:MAG: YqgE/AlgH family protein [Thermodesulfobacteriota bacterium]
MIAWQEDNQTMAQAVFPGDGMSGEKEKAALLKGELLIAVPTLTDPHFSRTVVCVCEFSAEGALGMVVNRPYSALSAKDLFDELTIQYREEAAGLPVYNGGPVNVGDVFVLHGEPFGWAGSHRVNPRLALTNTRDILEAIAGGRGPESFLIILGCSGWAGGQLEMELKSNIWLTAPADEAILFHTPPDQRWAKGLELIHIDPAFLSGTAGNA